MHTRVSSLFLAALGLAALVMTAGPVRAGEPGEEVPPFSTDRPDFTETSFVVPLGSLQLESGLTWENAAEKTFDLPELLLRYGVGRRTELRLGAPTYFRIRGDGRTESGFGGTLVGLKYQLGPLPGGWQSSIIPAVTLPTGGLSSGAAEPEVKLTWSRELGGEWSLGGLFGFFWPEAGGERDFTWQPTVVLGRSLGGPWAGFVEYVGEFSEGAGDVHLIHPGVTYALSAVSQLDLHFGIGISSAAPDFFIGAGYSARY